MKISLVISSMSIGGAERVMSNMANYWAENDTDVTLITLDSKENDFYSLDSRVHRVDLCMLNNSKNILTALKNNLFRLRKLRNAIKNNNPDVVISFIHRMNIMTLLATPGLGVPVLVSEHTDPRRIPPGGVWNQLRYITYTWASAVIVLTNELRDVASKFVSNKKLHVIPNAVIPMTCKDNTLLPVELNKPCIIAMGRLIPLKGFDLLLKAFALSQHDGWSLLILGEGPERVNLEILVKDLGLEDSVSLPGAVSEPDVVLQQADIFVLSSHYEGFPMALIEAMSCGLPVISFDCKTGPGDIIRNNIDGVLVPVGDVAALTSAMNRLMSDKEERRRMAGKAIDVVDRFSINKIMTQWDDVIASSV